jgi:hypothetical protein
MSKNVTTKRDHKSKPSEAEQELGTFIKFTTHVKGFERRVYGLVASSLVFSAITTAVNAVAFKSDPGFAALTILVSTIGGIGAVLLTFVGWSRHPMDEFRQLLNFQAAKFGCQISLWLLASVVGLYFYYLAARAGSLGSVLIIPIATFCFFRGLTLGALVTSSIDQQQILWQSLSSEGREEIIRTENEVRKRKEEYSELLRKTVREADEGTEEINRKLAEYKRAEILRRRDSRRRKLATLLSRIQLAWQEVRYSIGGNRLLSMRERADREVSEITINQRLKDFQANSFQELYLKISRGTIRPLRIEGTDIDVYLSGVWNNIVLRGTTNRLDAQALVDALGRFRDGETGKIKLVRIFLEELASLSTDARALLLNEGIVVVGAADGRPV